MEQTGWMDTKSAAEFLGISKSTLEHDRVSGRIGIPYSRLGGRVLYHRETLNKFLEAQMVEPGATAREQWERYHQ